YTASAQNPETDLVPLLAGAAHKDITPSTQVLNWVTGEPYGVIHDPIHTRALVISDGDHIVALIHWEIVDVGESARDEVRKRIAAELDIPEKHILVNAAHNHSAPWAPVYGADNHRGKERYPWWVTRHMEAQDDQPAFREWKEKLISESTKAVREAMEDLRPATMWLGRYDVSRFSRVRRPRPVSGGIIESHLP